MAPKDKTNNSVLGHYADNPIHLNPGLIIYQKSYAKVK